MALTFHVAGPCVVSVRYDGGAYQVLGVTGNDDLPSLAMTDHMADAMTVATGGTPGLSVYAGTEARLTLTLVSWDKTVLEGVAAHMRGSGVIGSMAYTYDSSGGRVVSKAFSLQIEPTIAGRRGYEFANNVVGTSDSIAYEQFGNVERTARLSLRALPFNNQIYTEI